MIALHQGSCSCSMHPCTPVSVTGGSEMSQRERLLPEFLGCDVYRIRSLLWAFVAKCALDQIPAFQVLIQAQPRTDSWASPGELRNTYLEETWRLRSAEKEAQRKAALAIGEQSPCMPVDWGPRRAHLESLFPGCSHGVGGVSVTFQRWTGWAEQI